MTMSEGHVFSLMLCFLVGAFPLMMDYLGGPKIRRLVWVWFLFWASPGLISLWLKGILG